MEAITYLIILAFNTVICRHLRIRHRTGNPRSGPHREGKDTWETCDFSGVQRIPIFQLIIN